MDAEAAGAPGPALPDSGHPAPHWYERAAAGIAVTLLYAMALYLVIWLVPGGGWLPFISGLIALPAAISGLAVALSDPRGKAERVSRIGIGMGSVGVAVLLAMIFFGEGAICVVLAAPFLLLGSFLGAGLTHIILRRFAARRGRRLFGISLLAPLVLLPLDARMDWPETSGAITTVIEIAASPAEVWALTTEIAEIAPHELPFTFSHGIVGVPQPLDARLDGTGPGAVRQLRWTRGVTFEEVITAWEENRYLAWDFRFTPESIPDEIEAHIRVDSDYLTLQRGHYRLEPVAGGTRLVLTTEFRFASPFNSYLHWWADVFLNDFHHAVLGVVKARAEAGQKRPPKPAAL